jgi:pimeloyl-ACP methyl ester carboxylesterase
MMLIPAPARLASGVFALLALMIGSPDDVATPRNSAPKPARVLAIEGVPSLRFEPIGLSVLRPYQRGKIPVVLVHGLWGSPWQWASIVRGIETDPVLRERYQVWTYGYSTGDPIPHAASLMREDLRLARLQLDPDRSDAAFDRMVIIGHSMGGLLAKMSVQDSGRKLWELIADKPIDDLRGSEADQAILRQCTMFGPLPEVRRVIFIATPHRGSEVDRASLSRLGSRVIRMPSSLQAAYGRLRQANAPDFLSEYFRGRLPTSIDELRWQSPILMRLCEIELAPGVAFHSIIADRRATPGPGGNDGLVSYRSSHLDNPASELLVSSGHLCLEHPAVSSEIRRILGEHGLGVPRASGP